MDHEQLSLLSQIRILPSERLELVDGQLTLARKVDHILLFRMPFDTGETQARAARRVEFGYTDVGTSVAAVR
jgi:hypothetical protein